MPFGPNPRLLLSLRGLSKAARIVQVASRLMGEETTVHLLHVADGSEEPDEIAGILLKETIENPNSLVEEYFGRDKRWHHSKQRARWFALGLLEAEQQMNRIAGHEIYPSSEKLFNLRLTSTKTPRRGLILSKKIN